MSGEHNPNELVALSRQVGELTGAVNELGRGVLGRIDDIRRDIQRLEGASNSRMDRIEDSLSKQIKEQGDQLSERLNSTNKRVSELEAEDKRLIEKTAKLGALGGGIGGALAAGLVELIKHIGK